MIDPNIFNQLLVWPIINLLVFFYKTLAVLGFPGAFGWAIILLTITIRLILFPLMQKQIKSQKKMAELKPQLDRLARKYKKDKKRLQQEQLRLYQRVGVNPAAGCLPLLIQMPVIFALYRVFFQLLSNGNLSQLINEINQILYFPFLRLDTFDFMFFGISLGTRPSQWRELGFLWLLVPVITFFLTWWQAKMMSLSTSSQQSLKKTDKGGEKESQKEKSSKGDKSDGDDMQQAMRMQMTIFMPLMLGYIAYMFPVGLSLYWNTQTVFGIIQQFYIQTMKD